MLGVGSVLFLCSLGMFAMGRVLASGTFGVCGMGSTMRLAQLLRFFEVVTFAGDKGRGRKNQEQVGSFHRAP